MPRATEKEIDESFDREGLMLDDEDYAFLHHILLDDAPRQGLHQFGDVREEDIEWA